MTLGMDSQELESYVPVYDSAPEEWKDARPFIVEQLKKISTAINIREIGFYLDTELLSGKAFIPSNNSPQQFRQVLRIVIDCSPLVIGANTFAHGITVDSRFTLIQLYAAATNATALTGEPIPNGTDTITYNVNNIIITVTAAYTRCFAVMEYLQEL